LKKDTFKMSIFILLFGGFIVKILGFIIRILFTRIIGTEGIELYTIVMPTYSLLVTIATLSLPISISKLVSEGKVRSKKIVFSTAFFILLLNTILIGITLLLAPFIATHLLKQPAVIPILIAMAATLPFVSLSSILKGYFLGKLKVHPNTISNILEQIVRIIFLIYFLPSIVRMNILWGVISFILLNIVSETVSIFTFCAFLPKNICIKKEDIKPNPTFIKRVLNISIPSVSGRLVGNIGFFLEPIILTNLLLFSGYSNTYILEEYAAYNAYAIGLLTLPSFFIGAICQILIPEISKYHANKNIAMVKRRLKQAIRYSFLIGITCTFLIFIFRNPLLQILYKTNKGSEYIFTLAPFFVLFYLEAPLSSALQAMDEAVQTMKISLYGIFLKLSIMATLSLCHIGIYSLVISEILNIIFVVYFNFRCIKKSLKNAQLNMNS